MSRLDLRGALTAAREEFQFLKQAFRLFFSPTWDHDDDPPDLEADAAKRTAWVEQHRRPEGG